MKLYTEEQLQKAYESGHMDGRLNNKDYSISDLFQPIELPSEQDIEKSIENRFNSETFIDNVCLSYRHDFGLMEQQDKERLRFECMEWFRAIKNNWGYFKNK